MNPRVKEVIATDEYTLVLTFKNEEKAIYDCKNLLDFGVFKEFQDIEYFKQAFVEYGTVTWPNEQDICPDTLYLDSKHITQSE
ncbi:MAG: DUF2442 domain-containing protein [Helicobacteraceae bacterium]|nr:DUF2442 domain-containing protein [Helicobacteraceae bacterium]